MCRAPKVSWFDRQTLPHLYYDAVLGKIDWKRADTINTSLEFELKPRPAVVTDCAIGINGKPCVRIHYGYCASGRDEWIVADSPRLLPISSEVASSNAALELQQSLIQSMDKNLPGCRAFIDSALQDLATERQRLTQTLETLFLDLPAVLLSICAAYLI